MPLDLASVFSPAPGPPQVIAEVGSNHNRDWALTLRLLDAVAQAGAAAAKFQTYSARTLYSRETRTAEYLVDKGLVGDGGIYALIERIELPRDWQPKLDAEARARGMTFFSTPFDLEAVAELEAIGVPLYKIASTEITHRPLLEAVGATGKPVILSTGMATLGDVERALEALGHQRVLLMQCTTGYPVAPESVQLRAMVALREAFQLPVGFSDHSEGSVAAAVAVALGARLLEKHVTLDRKLPGPDHAFAVEPAALATYVAAARDAYAMLGDGRKRPLPVEEEFRRYRPGLFAAADLAEGTVLARSDLTVMRRPGGGGIDAMELPRIVGRQLRRACKAGALLDWSDV